MSFSRKNPPKIPLEIFRFTPVQTCSNRFAKNQNLRLLTERDRVLRLDDLALDQRGHDARDLAHRVEVLERSDERHGAPEHEVAREDAVLVAELGGRGDVAATRVRLVDDIVVQKLRRSE